MTIFREPTTHPAKVTVPEVKLGGAPVSSPQPTVGIIAILIGL